jgi:hypothetical protein
MSSKKGLSKDVAAQWLLGLLPVSYSQSMTFGAFGASLWKWESVTFTV